MKQGPHETYVKVPLDMTRRTVGSSWEVAIVASLQHRKRICPAGAGTHQASAAVSVASSSAARNAAGPVVGDTPRNVKDVYIVFYSYSFYLSRK